MATSTPTVVFAMFCVLGLFSASLLVYRKYARPDLPPLVRGITILAWNAGLCVVYILPIDVASNPGKLVTLWRAVYWTSFVCTWMVMPVVMAYYASGYFTWKEKLKDSLKLNLRFIAVAGILYFVLVIWVGATEGFSSISEFLGLAIALANSWGLLLFTLLLGYGLVEIPRKIWNLTNTNKTLDKLYGEAVETYTELEAAMTLILRVRHSVDYLYGKTDGEALVEIESHFPDDLDDYKNAASRDILGYVRDVPTDKLPIVLAKLHKQVKSSSLEIRRSQFHFSILLEEIEEFLQGNDPTEDILVFSGPPKLAYRVFSICCGVLSAFIVFTEVTMSSSTNLSIFALITGNGTEDIVVESIGMLVLLYLCTCTFYSLFTLRLAKFYHLHPTRHTESNSLLFNASLLLRLNFPMCLNFLNLLRVSDSSFQRAFGHMDVVPVLGDSFNVYFPVLVLVFCVISYGNVLGKMLKCLGASAFDQDSSIVIAEGKLIVQRHKRKLRRRSSTAGAIDP